MPTIKFLPAETIIDVPKGTVLIDAARQAGIMIDFPCGGKGTCGKCLVRIIEGKVDSKSTIALAGEEKAAGYAYACQSTITEDVIISVPDQAEKQKSIDTDDSIESGLAPMPEISSFCPITKQLSISIPLPQKEDGLSDLDRVSRELKSILELDEIDFPLPVIQKLADTLRCEDGRVTVTLSADPKKALIVDIRSGYSKPNHLGMAIDLGTTTISVQLIDLEYGKILSTKNGYNDQIHCGLDVISRINYASRPDRLEDLRSRAVHSINRLIHEVVAAAGFESREIACARISGNTVMTHLLLGLKPEYIRLEPYTPTVLQIPSISAGELDIAINPNAIITFSPCVGSYVGGDITAGILCTDLAKNKEEICLFLDIGTNGEMVIGNKDFLLCCACSAGPAFEGGGIDCGMRATTGAIDSVTIDRNTGEAKYTTIGNAKPLGICGSGMIDLVASLFITGWLDSAGKLNRSKQSPSIHIEGRRAYYEIVAAGEAKNNKPVIISEKDIDNLLRAKAAIYSAAAILLKQIGMSFRDLAKFYVAGGFGQYLNMENAIMIGLLPDIPTDKFQYIGNTSLQGSYLLALSEEFRNTQTALTKRLTYIDLSNFPGFMDEYTAALFLPHTALHHFPKVMELLKTK